MPFIGPLFRRQTKDIEKVDLLIFITAKIVKEEDYTQEKIIKMQKELGFVAAERILDIQNNKDATFVTQNQRKQKKKQ